MSKGESLSYEQVQVLDTDKRKNSSLTSLEGYFKFEERQKQVCTIRKQGDKESIFSQIDSYNMIQKITLGKVEYCSSEGMDYVVKKGDILTGICKKYYGNSQVAYDLMEMYGVSERLHIGQLLFLPKKVGEYIIKSEYFGEGTEKGNIPNQMHIINSFIYKLEQVNRNYNPLDYFTIREYRKAFYENILKENFINKQSLLTQLKEYIDDSVNLIDYDEELLRELITQKNIIVEKQIKKFGIPDILHKDDTYIYLQNKIIKIQHVLKDTDRYKGKKIFDEAFLNLYKTLQQELLESYYGHKKIELGIIKNIAEIHERIEKGVNSKWEYIEIIGDIFNILRGSLKKSAELLGDILKGINHMLLYDPKKEKFGSLETVAHNQMDIYNEDFNILLTGTSFLSGMVDFIVDLGVGITTLVVSPDEVFKDLKKLPVVAEELGDMIFSKIFWSQLYDFYTQNTREALPLTAYRIGYMKAMWKAAKDMQKVSPNLISYAIKKGTKLGTNLWYLPSTLAHGVESRKLLREYKSLRVDKNLFRKEKDHVDNEGKELYGGLKFLEKDRGDLEYNYNTLKNMDTQHIMKMEVLTKLFKSKIDEHNRLYIKHDKLLDRIEGADPEVLDALKTVQKLKKVEKLAGGLRNKLSKYPEGSPDYKRYHDKLYKVMMVLMTMPEKIKRIEQTKDITIRMAEHMNIRKEVGVIEKRISQGKIEIDELIKNIDDGIVEGQKIKKMVVEHAKGVDWHDAKVNDFNQKQEIFGEKFSSLKERIKTLHDEKNALQNKKQKKDDFNKKFAEQVSRNTALMEAGVSSAGDTVGVHNKVIKTFSNLVFLETLTGAGIDDFSFGIGKSKENTELERGILELLERNDVIPKMIEGRILLQIQEYIGYNRLEKDFDMKKLEEYLDSKTLDASSQEREAIVAINIKQAINEFMDRFLNGVKLKEDGSFFSRLDEVLVTKFAFTVIKTKQKVKDKDIHVE